MIVKVKLISNMALELCRQRFEWGKNEKEKLSQNVLDSQGQAIIESIEEEIALRQVNTGE